MEGMGVLWILGGVMVAVLVAAVFAGLHRMIIATAIDSVAFTVMLILVVVQGGVEYASGAFGLILVATIGVYVILGTFIWQRCHPPTHTSVA